eukprot:9103915-Prorocentrum_lima.AAC.1
MPFVLPWPVYLSVARRLHLGTLLSRHSTTRPVIESCQPAWHHESCWTYWLHFDSLLSWSSDRGGEATCSAAAVGCKVGEK